MFKFEKLFNLFKEFNALLTDKYANRVVRTVPNFLDCPENYKLTCQLKARRRRGCGGAGFLHANGPSRARAATDPQPAFASHFALYFSNHRIH
jgi:hypothetical protein